MKREEQIFEQAIAFPTAEERQAYVRGVCADDPQLRRRVEELLTAFSDAGQMDFLQTTERAEAKTDLQDSPLVEDAGTRIGRYKLLQHIGEGGFGSVFMAEQEEPVRRKVALKIIKLGMDTKQVIARFEAERQALAMMDHPNIAKVLDAGATETGRPYFVMELVKGVPITEFCDKNKLSTEDRLRLFIPVCQAIQSAHQKGIIHRDIKPSNVLVTLEHGEPLPKVIDFGVAKATNQRLTEKTLFTNYATLIGTPAYMSPEQAEMSSLDIDTRADIYSLGVLLYELVTGTTPFSEERLRSVGYGEMQRIIAQEEPERPSTRLSTMTQAQRATVAMNRGANPSALEKAFGSDLDWIVMKCLEKNRSRRYETANGLALDITRHLHNEPIVARPPSTFYKIHKFARRNKVAFTAGVAVLTALLVGLGLANYGLVQARKERDQAEREKTAADKARAAALASEQRLLAQERVDRQRAYTSAMKLAQQAWDDGDLPTAQASLQSCMPKTGESDLRGFEWRYLWSLCKDESLRTVFLDSSDRAWGILTSPRHTFAAMMCEKSLRLLDPLTLEELVQFSYPNTPQGRSLHSFALASHATNIIAAHRSGGVVGIWDIGQRQLLSTLQAFTNDVGYLALSSDGKLLAAARAGSVSSVLSLWNISSPTKPQLLWSYPSTNGTISALTFSLDNETLYAGRTADGAHVAAWNVATGDLLPSLPQITPGKILVTALSPDGKWLAFSGNEWRIRVVDLQTQALICELEGPKGSVTSLSFSPDGRRLISAGEEPSVRIFDIAARRLVDQLRCREAAMAAAFSPDGSSILTAAKTRAQLWRANSRPPTIKIETGPRWGWPLLSPDGKWLVISGSFSPAAQLMYVANPSRTRQFSYKAKRSLALAFSPDGRYFAMANVSKEGLIGVWDTAHWTDEQADLAPLQYLTNHFETGSIAFSPDGKIMASAGLYFVSDDPSGATNRLSFWEVGSRTKLNLLPSAGAASTDTSAAATVAFSPDGALLAIGYRDGWVRLWDFKTQRLIKELKRHTDNWVGAEVGFSPDGRWLVSFSKGSSSVSVSVFDLTNPEEPREVALSAYHLGGVWAVAFTPDSKSLITHSSDGLVKFWNLQNLDLSLTLRHGYGPGGFLSINSDGTLMATLDAHGTLKFWPAPTFQQIEREFPLQ